MRALRRAQAPGRCQAAPGVIYDAGPHFRGCGHAGSGRSRSGARDDIAFASALSRRGAPGRSLCQLDR